MCILFPKTVVTRICYPHWHIIYIPINKIDISLRAIVSSEQIPVALLPQFAQTLVWFVERYFIHWDSCSIFGLLSEGTTVMYYSNGVRYNKFYDRASHYLLVVFVYWHTERITDTTCSLQKPDRIHLLTINGINLFIIQI